MTSIAYLQKKYIQDRHLVKSLSNNIVINLCPYCSFANICRAESKDGTEKVCILKSTESLRVWIRITDSRPKIEEGNTYGNTKVISINNKDESGKIYWNCIRNNQMVIVRGDNLLRNVADRAERKYRRGSSINPDGTLHKYPTEHTSKYGCAVEKAMINTVIDEDTGDHHRYVYEDRVLCRCGSVMRYDEYGEGICSSCVGLERRSRKPTIDPEVKPNSGYKGMGELEVRSINRDTRPIIEKHEPTRREIEEECEALVIAYKKWCQSF